MVSRLKKIFLHENISIMKGYFVTKFFKAFITYQDLSFGGFAFKIEFVDFVYKLIFFNEKRMKIINF